MTSITTAGALESLQQSAWLYVSVYIHFSSVLTYKSQAMEMGYVFQTGLIRLPTS